MMNYHQEFWHHGVLFLRITFHPIISPLSIGASSMVNISWFFTFFTCAELFSILCLFCSFLFDVSFHCTILNYWLYFILYGSVQFVHVFNTTFPLPSINDNFIIVFADPLLNQIFFCLQLLILLSVDFFTIEKQLFESFKIDFFLFSINEWF